jgi:hypothetical protein
LGGPSSAACSALSKTGGPISCYAESIPGGAKLFPV